VWESSQLTVVFPSKYSLDRNNTIASLFHTQYTPDFLAAEYCGWRNTIFWGSSYLASEDLLRKRKLHSHYHQKQGARAKVTFDSQNDEKASQLSCGDLSEAYLSHLTNKMTNALHSYPE
jgi:hypothetical protein